MGPAHTRGHCHHFVILRALPHSGGCKAPSDCDPRLQFTPSQTSYALGKLIQLSCTGDYRPPVPQIRCIPRGTQSLWNEKATCRGKHSPAAP